MLYNTITIINEDELCFFLLKLLNLIRKNVICTTIATLLHFPWQCNIVCHRFVNI